MSHPISSYNNHNNIFLIGMVLSYMQVNTVICQINSHHGSILSSTPEHVGDIGGCSEAFNTPRVTTTHVCRFAQTHIVHSDTTVPSTGHQDSIRGFW
jgi:hypothetical protein